ncbi:ABC transporter type 1, transmembrane domain-containing protein, partial [Lentinula detonsa]
LWSLPHSRLTSHLTDELERHFYSILPDEKQAAPSSYQSADHVTRSDETEKTEMRENPNEQVSLLKAIYRQFFWQCWYTGSLTLIAQTLPTLTPLVTKALLTWLTDSYVFFHLSPAEKQESLSSEPQGIGYGVGVAIGLFFMQQGASLVIAMSLGLSVRTAIIGCITRKSLRLSARARLEHPSGQIFTMISTDADRADKFCIYGHHLWIAPIQVSFILIITAGLLIATLGYSALVGLGVLILSLPVQTVFVVIMMKQRQKGVKITDSRIRLTTEVLQGIRLLKLYAWEKFYTGKITELRKGELETVRNSLFATAGLFAMVTFVPILASVLSFVIQLPLIMLPITLASLSDVFVAFTRISAFSLRGLYRFPAVKSMIL